MIRVDPRFRSMVPYDSLDEAVYAVWVPYDSLDEAGYGVWVPYDSLDEAGCGVWVPYKLDHYTRGPNAHKYWHIKMSPTVTHVHVARYMSMS